jgi:hypothetical protein
MDETEVYVKIMDTKTKAWDNIKIKTEETGHVPIIGRTMIILNLPSASA